MVSAVDDEEVGGVSMVVVLVRTAITSEKSFISMKKKTRCDLLGFVNDFNANMRKPGCAGGARQKSICTREC
jgi:hypothetical protein